MRPAEELHDLVTRGEKITDEEQVRLDEWYAELEREESETLFGTPQPPSLSQSSLSVEEEQLLQLQNQIDALVNQLAEKTAHLQRVLEQNKLLQKEIAFLRTHVASEVGLATA